MYQAMRYFGCALKYAFTRSVRVTASAKNATACTNRSSGSAQLSEEASPGSPEALATQAADAEFVVGPFQ